MSKKKKLVIRTIAVIIALLMPVFTAIVANASTGETEATMESSRSDVKYDVADINSLTGHGEEPEELSVSAGAEYLEKAWYEYVTYSDNAVASYRLDDDTRLLFYDPYTYTNAMVMEVKFDATTTEFDTMSSYTISKTNTKSISACIESTDTSTSSTQTSGRDIIHTDVTNGGTTKTTYNHDETTKTTGKVSEKDEYFYKSQDSVDLTISETLDIHTTTGTETGLPKVYVDVGSQTTVQDTFKQEWLTDYVNHDTVYSDDYKTTTTYSGTSEVEDNTTSTTDGWTELSARVTKTLGSSRSTSNSWSEEESVTVTKTYAATHFASDGVTPLPWAIVHYDVQMPMKVCLQMKISGEWVTVSTIYSMLSTVKGTCRAWMQNGQVYYEDWGSGEPVVEENFWSQFMTKSQLIKMYSEKLFPEGGND